MTINEESFKAWEQDHIEFLTSREMGEWLHRRDINAKRAERPTGKCENCDYRKFTETFIDGVVEVMNKNGISSVEQLSEILKGAEE